MNNQPCLLHPLNLSQDSNVAGFDSLAGLALDMRWSWDHATDQIWRRLDPELWQLTHNPWVVLQTASRERIERLLADPVFCAKVSGLMHSRRSELETPAWFQHNHAHSSLDCIAYFSMEFMLSEALPIYSGGLGNVAGDQLQAASDLGVPVAAVGLLYQQGYFRQVIDKDGAQQALFPYNDPGQLPITPLRHANGEWLRLEIALPGYSVWLRAWQVQVGRVQLYLLDSNDAANFPAHRGITSELYGGGPELRLKQELILGIGGWRLLAALGIHPQVCHLNEGHAAFAVLERARSFMEASGQPFETALAATRAGNLFTTHTAVAAGFDRFEPALIGQYLANYAGQHLGLSLSELLALGRANPNDSSEPFNMAYLAIHGSGAVNGVSRLHGQVSRKMLSPLFPHWPEDETPIDHVTNGVHMPSWDSAEADALWTEACGKDRWLGMTDTLEQDINQVSNDALWKFRVEAGKSFVAYVRGRLTRQLAASAASPETIEAAADIFDPHALTLGFARRFATYKRPNLLLHDPERLIRLLTRKERPVQLIIAGKAHPADQAGQALIQEWTRFMRRPETRGHVAFLSDYDMLVTEQLVQGVDVWLNTPKRPWEACGTSGMKVLVNGGVNLSELDGWWAEAYSPEVGWALGDGQEHGDDPAWDAAEAGALYDLLEQEVVPEFYDRNKQGIPIAWMARMRASMAQLTPRFSASRTVREYTERYYLPACERYRKRAADNGAGGATIAAWRRDLEQHWEDIRFGEVRVVAQGDLHRFDVAVFLNNLSPQAVRVELYADGNDAAPAVRLEMRPIDPTADPASTDGLVYGASASAARPAADYSVRLTPCCEGVAIPLECAHILWQR